MLCQHILHRHELFLLPGLIHWRASIGPCRCLDTDPTPLLCSCPCFPSVSITFIASVPAPQQERQGHIDTELATVISSISLACKQIAAAVGRSGISSLTGVAGTGENVQVGVLTIRIQWRKQQVKQQP